jgi:hypothetical protein
MSQHCHLLFVNCHQYHTSHLGCHLRTCHKNSLHVLKQNLLDIFTSCNLHSLKIIIIFIDMNLETNLEFRT